MRLFWRDSLLAIAMFIVGGAGNLYLIDYLDGIEENRYYFLFLNILILLLFLVFRYLLNSRFYRRLDKPMKDVEDIFISSAYSGLEKKYSQRAQDFYRIYTRDVNTLKFKVNTNNAFITHSMDHMEESLTRLTPILEGYDEFSDGERVEKELTKTKRSLAQIKRFLIIDSLEKTVNKEDTAIADILKDVMDELKPMLREKDMIINMSVPEDLKAITDKNWLTFAIYQIVLNAIMYGDGKTSIDIKRVVRGERIGLSIVNRGIGILSTDEKAIFNMYYVGMNNPYDKEATGIGLYMANKICEQLSHRLYLENSSPENTEFIILL